MLGDRPENFKTKIGRGRIDSPNRAFVSKRAMQGTLTVIREGFRCLNCSHDKAFKKHGRLQCTRCHKY